MALQTSEIITVDPILSALNKARIYSATFRQLTGVDDPLDLTLDRIRGTRESMARYDRVVRARYVGRDVTCLAWTEGAFWLLPQGVREYFRAIEEVHSRGDGWKVLPLWRLTLREMVANHLGNLKRLILSVAYDLVTIDAFREQLPRDYTMLKKEFSRCERVAAELIGDLLQERDRLVKLLDGVTGRNVELYERAYMTERMIETGQVTTRDLGYGLEDLKRAQQRIHELCQRELAVYEHILNLTRGKMQEGLRGGERAQLARTNRMDYAFHQLDEVPEGFGGMVSLVAFERRRLATLVAAREEELGPSEEGGALLTESKALDEAPPVAPPKPKEPPRVIKRKLVRRTDSVKPRRKT